MLWSYGVTTVPERFETHLPRTLASLAKAGFEHPRLFIDGAGKTEDWRAIYDVTQHSPRLRTYGNWITAAWELYLRVPNADRYAIFQDDFVTYRNLRQYLEQCAYPADGYLNLYTFPCNTKPNEPGWSRSPGQNGRGAVALVFSNHWLRQLLQSNHAVERVRDAKRGHQCVDGCVVDSIRKADGFEYIHNPSLVQHIGIVSSMGNAQQALAPSFISEEYDALELLRTTSTG